MVNEATLTGESVPVPKGPMLKDDSEFDFQQQSGSILYEGTKVMTVNKS